MSILGHYYEPHQSALLKFLNTIRPNNIPKIGVVINTAISLFSGD